MTSFMICIAQQYYWAIKWCIEPAGQVTVMGRNGQEGLVEEVWKNKITWKVSM
jgi:hypothetical protein